MVMRFGGLSCLLTSLRLVRCFHSGSLLYSPVILSISTGLIELLVYNMLSYIGVHIRNSFLRSMQFEWVSTDEIHRVSTLSVWRELEIIRGQAKVTFKRHRKKYQCMVPEDERRRPGHT